ncbi:T9SS type A sorting domain-containing protein [Neolewinella agarilytica]|nr:T9SS type A sorting domain-containing protein [Neolewinella agarilytica]
MNDEEVVDNDDIDGNGMEGGDEDDHDIETVTIETFDLALIKTLAPMQAATVEPGDTIAYTITVINQGDIPADNIVVTDYPSTELVFETMAGNGMDDNTTLGWSVVGGFPTTTLTVADGELPAGGLAPGASATIDIFLTLTSPLLPPGLQIDNFAEISGATDENGDEQTDDDSVYDTDPDDDTLTSDNEVDGNGNNPGEDDDDHDIASITIEGFDLALTKGLSDGQSDEVRPGDTIAYTITVINQGMIAADNIEVTDYLDADGNLSFEAGVTGNEDWMLVGGFPTTTLTVADGELPVGGLAPGAMTTVEIFLTLANPLPSGAVITNVAEISAATDENGDPQDDTDSTPDTTPGDDEDDIDDVSVTVQTFDVALIKELAAGQDMIVAPGDTVAYTITVFNQGDIPADNIEVTDYVPADMTFEPGAGNGTDDNTSLGWAVVAGNPTATITIPGGLAPGASTTIDIYLTLASPLPAGSDISNFAEISDATDENGDEQVDIDSELDNDPDDDDLTSDNEVDSDGSIPGQDDDDHDVAVITTAEFDLALTKTLSSGQSANVRPGDTIAYTITVINQGDIAADNVLVTDYLPADMSLTYDGTITGNDDAGWAAATAGVQRTLTVAAGDLPAGGLAPGATASVEVFLTLASPLPAGSTVDNFAEISGATDETGDPQDDTDSTPDDMNDEDVVNDDDIDGNGMEGGDEDDHDIETVTIETFDLALTKTLAVGQSFDVRPGDTIAYTITVINQGDIAADNVLVTDYLPADMSLIYEGGVMGNDDAGWAVAATGVQRTLTVAAGDLPAGGLAPGATASVDIFLTLANPLPAGSTISNFAEISDATDENGDPQVDEDSTPDDMNDEDVVNDDEIDGNGMEGGDEDDHDIADVMVQSFDLALIKTLAATQSPVVEPGDTVAYTITVINQGDIPADNVTVTDYLPAELSFEMMAGNGTDDNTSLGWTDVAGNPTATLSVAGGQLPAGGLAPGASASIDIFLTLASPLLPPGTQIDNFAEISDATDENGDEQTDDDSVFDTDPDDDTLTSDNEVDGDGNNPGEDDDDHDIASITIEGFDLALTKTLSPGQSSDVAPGDTIAYTITVINQGMIAADNILVTDYLPADGSLTYEGGVMGNDDAGWALASAGPQRTLTAGNELPVGGLAPGETASVEIFITLANPLPAGAMISNFAEISAATDENGDPQDDIDSTPDDMNDEDVVNDNEIDGNGNEGGDEDDHDVEVVTVQTFDLALQKMLAAGQSNMVNPGDTITYDLVVTNQGDIAADNIPVVDFIPPGMTLDETFGNYVLDPATMTATDTFTVADGEIPAGGLLPGESVTFQIQLVVTAPVAAGTSLRNIAELGESTDQNGDPQVDDDSVPVDPNNPDTIDDNDDDDIDGDGTNGGDEDESDFEDVIINTFDLALAKILSPGQSAQVQPGDTVSFDIVITNQGDINADNVMIADFIPSGMMFDGTISGNEVWSETGGVATTVLTVAEGELPVGGIAPGQTATATIMLVLASPQTAGMSLRNFAEIQDATDDLGNEQIDDDSDYNENGEPVDEIADTDNDNIDGDGQNGGDEDESDFEDVEILTFDLALQKMLAAGQSNMVNPGDTITYDLVITNQGAIAADNIPVVDFIPAGMSLDMSFGNFVFDAATNTATDTFTVADGELPVGGLAAGTSATFQIQLVLDAPLAGDLTFRNIAELGESTDENGNPQVDDDSTPVDPNNPDVIDDNDDDDINGDGTNGGDEDESDFEDIITNTFDLALTKTLSPGQSANVDAGDTVAFTIRVFNQGAIAADNIRVSDYAPSAVDGFMFDPSLNPDWMVYADINDTTYIETTLTDFDGADALEPGAFVDVEIFLTVNPAMEAVMSLTNIAEVSDATDGVGNDVIEVDSPMDTIPGNDTFTDDNDVNGDGLAGGDEDNSDPATIFVGGFDLALIKTLADGESNVVSAGDEVTFDITVINQGAITADNIVVVDYVPAGFLFDPALNPGWALNDDGNPIDTLSIANGDLFEGGLEPGESTTTQITLTVAPEMFPDYTMGVMEDPEGVESGQVLINEAEIASATDEDGNEVDDIDSTPDDTQGNDGDIDDDDVNGGGDTDGDGIIDDDEDDNDIAIVTVECYQDPGVDNTITVCLGCDEAEVVINLFESLAGLPNIGGTFTEGDLFFMDEDGNPIAVDLSDPENVVIPGTLDRSRDYSIDYTIAAVNDCPEMTATITIDIFDIQNLSCSGFQNISLGEDCEAEITPDLILQGNLVCANSLEVVLLTSSGDTLRDANGMPTSIVGNDQVNETLFVSLVDPMCDNSCWGQILVEDKKRPEIECPDDVSGFDGKDFICTDIDQILNQESSLDFTGRPFIADNCTPTDELILEFSDFLIPNPDPQCTVQTILRTFTVTDESGNFNSCVQEITVRPATLDDVTIPTEEVIEISCGTDYETLPNGNPVPSLGGEPTIMTALGMYNIPGNEGYCTIAAGFTDGERIVTCPETFKFVRTYRIFDWCDPDGDPITYTQVIKVGDFDAPVFTGPTQDNDFDGVADDGPLVFPTNTGDECTAIFRLDDASITLTDNCSETILLSATIYPNGDLTSTPIGTFTVDLNDGDAEITSPIPVGTHILRYTYVDACGNSDFTDLDFTVEDRTAPVAICEDGLNISLTSGAEDGGVSTGVAILTPDMIDAGSSDDCSDVTLMIARVNADNIATEAYDQEITLTCADIGVVRVGLKVTDALGNENFCWLDVLVEDKNAPTCIAPAPIEISCIVARATLPSDIMEATEEELNAAFGFATGVDNCSVTVTSTISGDVNSCGVGSLTRIFTATDGEGFTNTNNCRQRITIYGVHDYRLTFPTDEEGTCAEVPDYNGIVADEDACDLITTDVVVDTLRTLEAGEECFKLRVTYDVINWCEYNTLGQPYLIPRDGDGIRNPETQVLYLNVNPGADDQTTADDFAFLSRFSDRNYNPNAPQRDQLLDDGDDTDGSDDDNGSDNIDDDAYAADDSRGHFRYIQFIKIYDEVAPTIDADAPAECFAGTSATCTADVELTFTAIDECSAATVALELDANYVVANGFNADNAAALGITITRNDDGNGNFTVNATNVPEGNHAIRVVASDGCGNSDVEIIEFCVTGDKAPTPICIQTLTATLMPDGNGGGMAAIWASDFIASDVEDCFGNVIDKYSIYTEVEAGATGFGPAAGRDGIDLTCADLGDLPVRVYSIDDRGNADYCSVVVEVQAFQEGLCEDTGGNLAGVIMTESMNTVEDVVVNLEGVDDMTRTMTTLEDGAFIFTGLPVDADYTITPTHFTDYLNGVRTSDIVAITRHILGVNLLNSPYKYVAADVDGNTEINVGDIISIRRLILGLSDAYPNEMPSWSFIPADYEFATLDNPWAESFPSVINVNDFNANIVDADFIGVKLGDVNSSAVANAQQPAVPRSLNGALELELDETEMMQGETYRIPVTAPDLTEVDGYQFTFEFDQTAVTIESIEAGLVGQGNFGWRFANQGLITTSWNWDEVDAPANWTGEEVLFTVVVRAEASGKLSEALDAGSRYTEAEAYTRGGEGLRNLSLIFNEETVEVGGYSLLQNVPNPVRKETTIGFQLPVAHDEVTISVTDAAGRLVKEFNQEGFVGYNSVRVSKRQLGGASGVYTYTVTAGEWIATKRMVIVK